MLRLFTLLLLLSTLLWALSSQQELDLAKKNLYSHSKERQFSAYDTYKRYYIKALIKDDKALILRCLDGICIAGKKLRIDVSSYEKKRKNLEKKSQKKPSKIEKYNPPKPVTVKVSKNKKSKRLKLSSKRGLRGFRWEDKLLVLSFDFRLKSRDVNYFTLKPEGNKGYRYIFDVDAIVYEKPVIKHREIKRITISQYKTNKIRIVIESIKPLHPRFSFEDNELRIALGVSTVYAPKAKVGVSKSQNSKRLIIIDPGHGGRDGGAVGYKRHLEKDIVLKISKKLAKILRSDGYRVKMTRDKDKTVSLKYRTKYTRKNHPDLFISIHANSVPKKNAHKAKGIEIYYLDPKRGSQRSNRLERKENAADYSAMNSSMTKLFVATQSRAKVIESNFLAIDMGQNVVSRLREKRYKVKDAKVAGGNFWVLVGATSAAVLVEVGFVSNPSEVNLLIKNKYQNTFAEGLADGVNQYFRNKERR